MDFLSILPDQDNLKIRMLDWILQRENSKIMIGRLQEELNISAYKFEDCVASINMDTEAMLGEQALVIKQNLLLVEPVVTIMLEQRLRAYYFEHAPLQILLGLYFKNNAYPNFKFLETNYGWSRSYFFKQKKLLNNLITTIDFERSEINKRIMCYNLYQYYGHAMALENNVDLMLAQKVEKLLLCDELGPNQLEQGQLLIAIMVKRINTAGVVVAQDETFTADIPEVTKIFMDIFKLEYHDAAIESGMLCGALFVQGLLNAKWSQLVTVQVNHEPRLLVIKELIARAMQPIFSLNRAQLNQQFLDKASLLIFAEQIPNHVTFQINKAGKDYFSGTFPMINRAITDLIMRLSREGLVKDPEKLDNIYFRLVILIITLEFRIAIDDVEVCFDFSGGELVNGFMIKTLNSFANLNVRIVKKVGPKTDIYLSDYYNGDVNVEQLIWAQPPMITDWGNLVDLIIRITNSRAQKEK